MKNRKAEGLSKRCVDRWECIGAAWFNQRLTVSSVFTPAPAFALRQSGEASSCPLMRQIVSNGIE